MPELILGLDLGSRAVKAVLYDLAGSRVAAACVRDGTSDKTADAELLIREVMEAAGTPRENLLRIVATGYGRVQPGLAHETATEISCHAVGVAAVRPEVRTVIDIGGQDCKSILLADDGSGKVRDFALNDRCAAGCGRFLEVAARILGSDIDGLSALARRASAESEISSMCVVFAESEVIGMIARGVPREEIAAGIVRSIARRVAGLAERVGVRAPVAFTGGVALNEAMVAALGRELRERLIVPADPRITGALGAALVGARRLGHQGRLAGIAVARGIPEAEPKHVTIADFRAGESAPRECGLDSGPVPLPPRGAGAGPGRDRDNTAVMANASEAPSRAESRHGAVPNQGAGCHASAAGGGHIDATPRSACLHTVPALARFDRTVANALDFAREAKAAGKKIVSTFCEFTPREIIMAAGAVPVCACGGSHKAALDAERDLPAGLCPLIKSSYGFALEKASPFFEMSDLVVAETTCDGKKKMFELLGGFKPIHVLELPQKPDDVGAYGRWKSEVEGLCRRMEALTGNAVTGERLAEAIRMMNRERALRREIASRAGNPLTGREILAAKSQISGIPEDLEAYEMIIAQSDSAASHPKDHLRIAASALQWKRPRILMTGVPMPQGAEKVLEIIEAAGATVVAQENCTGLKPILEDVAEEGDPVEAIARKYLHLPCSCMTPNAGRMEYVDRLIEDFKPGGIVDLVWQSCLTYDVESEVLRRHIERKHGLPFLKIVTDYSPSDVQQIRLRVDAFLSLVAGSVSLR
ncbi:MAG: acyl-CoA dehydratase activase [Acidobacteriia bacterium]|nr:acyl-CoA dehydratase activase [Terriglobia bacterium]